MILIVRQSMHVAELKKYGLPSSTCATYNVKNVAGTRHFSQIVSLSSLLHNRL